jgi:GH43 family beta-xylosidase
MLKLVNKDNLMKNSSWKKYQKPVFKSSPQSGVYATGHNSFFMSPDSSQYWILYHANSKPHEGCGSSRSPRMQQFHWNEDGTPNFGLPAKTGLPLVVPSR